VAVVAPPLVNDAGDTAVIAVLPTTGPQDQATSDLIDRLRNEVVPRAGPSGATTLVGGVTAVFDDFADFVNQRAPLFLGVVLLVSFLLLVVVFRSLLVPLKAVLMNLLTIGAAFGVLVAIFQWGWGASLIGLDSTGPIQPFLPLMLFAIVFGLSMDYEVFLISRMSEEYHRHGDNGLAVADGLASTARVITAAAAIMITIFSSFVASSDPLLKMSGIGLAVAILLDATVVRIVLVPATMELLGKANWWLPRWLDRILPRVHLDAAPDETPAVPPPVSANGHGTGDDDAIERPRPDTELRHRV
jgi:RND superfamily putative drug exporter